MTEINIVELKELSKKGTEIRIGLFSLLKCVH